MNSHEIVNDRSYLIQKNKDGKYQWKITYVYLQKSKSILSKYHLRYLGIFISKKQYSEGNRNSKNLNFEDIISKYKAYIVCYTFRTHLLLF